MTKFHLAVTKPNAFGGFNTSTLCGRDLRSYTDDTVNAVEQRQDVTCGHCVKILANPKSWQYRKWLGDATP